MGGGQGEWWLMRFVEVEPCVQGHNGSGSVFFRYVSFLGVRK